MITEAKPPSGGFWTGVWWFAVALALYVLSTGPVLRLGQAGCLPDGIARVMYAPLWAVAPEQTPQGAVLVWYIFRLWKVEVPPYK